MTVKHNNQRRNISDSFALVCTYSAISLALIIPFLVPFSASTDIDLQGYVLIASGLLAILSLILRPPNLFRSYGKTNCIIVGLIVLSYLVSTIFTDNHSYGLIGAPYVRYGLLSLISALSLSILINAQIKSKLSYYLFLYLSFLNVTALIYALIKYHSLYRLGGLFSQADLAAMMIGINLIFALEVYKRSRSSKVRIAVSIFILFLLVEMALTQTRAVIYLSLLISTAWYLFNFGIRVSRKSLIMGILALLVLGCTSYIVSSSSSGRITNLNYALQSTSYRLSLQKDAVKQIIKKPIIGWGPGNTADALDCKYLTQAELKKTCSENYFFNSSHNIFLDHYLMLGFIGGSIYLIFIVINLYKSIKQGVKNNIYWFVNILIAGYYLTNVTNLELETIFWISMGAMIITSKKQQRTS